MEPRPNSDKKLSKKELISEVIVFLGLAAVSWFFASGEFEAINRNMKKRISEAIITETSVPPGTTPQIGNLEKMISRMIITETPTLNNSR
jgi:hypothetical protein